MTLRKVNVILLLLVGVAFVIIVQRNLLRLGDLLHKESPDSGLILPFEGELSPDPEPRRRGEEIPVLLTAAEDRLGAVIAAMNSVYHNTKANVVFTVVALNGTVDHLKEWLSKTKLKKVKIKILVFEPSLFSSRISKEPQTLETSNLLTFARFYLPVYIPGAEKAIYLDDDIIVQGDIKELYDSNLKAGHAAAFSDDCDSGSAKGIIRGAGNQNNYIVENQNITQQLEHWMELNTREELYSKNLAGSITTPPLLLVFYKRHSSIDPLWHVRHLGTTGAGNRYSPQFVRAAKLLHWNGHYKPWGRLSSFTDVWDKWFIPDPAGKFQPVRRHAD
ncbi:hypothetical protein OJAV_G00040550 [Oryzias javanicus]|uniref:Glycosyltransferase 8 domain-containing protein 1 n=1 Tax=Oryzias javanicus TaxID=123683 RepID=A0A437DCU1_ORYJA|nr:hypothetical protein OJAV_G00040550 [Oryzias javanicus]